MTTRFRARRLGFAACAVVFLAAGCGSAAPLPSPSPSPSPLSWLQPAESPLPADARDAEVYRAVLAHAPSRTVVGTTRSPMTFLGTVEESLSVHGRDLPGLHPSTVRAFLDLNRTPALLPEPDDSTRVRVSEAEWIESLKSADGRRTGRWRRGAMVLSRVGYSDDRTQALVYVAHVCPLCGSGTYVLLARTGDGWTVIAEALDWLS